MVFLTSLWLGIPSKRPFGAWLNIGSMSIFNHMGIVWICSEQVRRRLNVPLGPSDLSRARRSPLQHLHIGLVGQRPRLVISCNLAGKQGWPLPPPWGRLHQALVGFPVNFKTQMLQAMQWLWPFWTGLIGFPETWFQKNISQFSNPPFFRVLLG